MKPDSITMRGTKGALLIERGCLQEGIAMLKELKEQGASENDKSISAYSIAYATLKMGIPRRRPISGNRLWRNTGIVKRPGGWKETRKSFPFGAKWRVVLQSDRNLVSSPMKQHVLLSLVCAISIRALSQDAQPAAESVKPSEPAISGERDGAALILHRDEVLKDRGHGKHLWPLLNTPEARVNYFEVTGRGALHYHPDADHRLYVLEGTVMVTCGQTTTKCTAGDFIVIPKGVRHCYDVPAPGEKSLLLTFDAPPYDPKKTVNVEAKANGK